MSCSRDRYRQIQQYRPLTSLPSRAARPLTDDLTGLGNRRLLYRQLDTALAQRPDGRAVALLIVDLDRFKEINDALGHHLGNQLLRQVGPCLATQLRRQDLLVRPQGRCGRSRPVRRR